nr:YbhB/YbcL family Raf kinase inhibitor-like protein [Syntrophales bacterium]
MILKSPAFEEGGMIPDRHTCDGENISPPLEWEGAPEGVKSYALLCEDPDAPMGSWVHWVVYDIPPSIAKLPEQVPSEAVLVNGGRQGTNDFYRMGYGGPCPPSGTHRYFFRL